MLEHLRPSAKVGLTFTAIMLVTFLAFRATLQHDFVNYDDDIYVYENPHIQTPSWENIRWLFSNIYFTQYIPVTMLSHAVDYAIWSSNARGHHLTNVVLHCVNAGWVFLLGLITIGIARQHRVGAVDSSSFLQMTGALPLAGSAFAALLFALHPLRAESVAWVSDRKDLLCTIFLVPSCIAYIRYSSLGSTAQAQRWYIVCLVLFVFALLSKSIAVVAPALFLVIDYLLLPKAWHKTFGSNLSEKIPFLVPAVLATFIVMASAPHAKTNAIVSRLSGFEPLLFPFYSIFFYLQKMVLPFGLAPVYPSVTQTTLIVSCAVVLGITIICAILALRRQHWPLLAWTTFVIILIPVMVTVFSGSQPFADRYSYVATISLFLLVGGGLEHLWRKMSARPARRAALVSGCVLVLGAFSVLTVRQVGYWQSSESLWGYVLADNPAGKEYLDGWVNLGQAYMKNGKYDEAKAVFRKAIAIDPRGADAYFNMAYAYYYMSQADTAMALFRKTLQFDTTYAQAFYNIGIMHLKMNNEPAGLDSLKKAARLGYTDAQQLLSSHNISW